MQRRLAIAAALSAVLAVTACGSSQPLDASGSSAPEAPRPTAQGTGADSAIEADGAGSSSVRSSAGREPLADPGTPGLPAASGASLDDVLRAGAVATWIDEPEVLAISLPVAADCWPTAAPPAVVSESELEVAFTPAECGDAQTARTYTIDVPDDIEPDADFEIALAGLDHEVTLPLPAR